MSGDAAETGGVDVGVRVVPYRPVQYIHRVGTDGERRSLGKPGPFLKRHVEAEAGWPFKAGQRQSEVSRRTRLRVLKNDISRAVDNDVVAEAAGHRRISAEVRRRRPPNGQALEEFDEPIPLPDLSETGRQRADQIRSINAGSRSAIAAAVQSPPCRGDTQRLPGVPGEDTRNIPTLNEPVNPARSAGKQRPVGAERQISCAVRFEGMRAVERQQALLQLPVPRIAFADGSVARIGVAGSGIAKGSRPRIVELSADALGQTFS